MTIAVPTAVLVAVSRFVLATAAEAEQVAAVAEQFAVAEPFAVVAIAAFVALHWDPGLSAAMAAAG